MKPIKPQMDIVDLIAEELLTIEESAKMMIGCSTITDQCLEELNMPAVAELLLVSYE